MKRSNYLQKYPLLGVCSVCLPALSIAYPSNITMNLRNTDCDKKIARRKGRPTMKHADGRRILRGMAHFITLIALLSGAITSLNFLNQKALGQQYGEPCATCTENKYNCDVQAEWDYQRCRRDNPLILTM